jgi:SHS2 domain-containing protein
MYEIFEHTADLGIRVRAASLNELFADAAGGLFSVMVANLETVRTVEEASFELPGQDVEELLHDWLTELLYTFHARRLVLPDSQVQAGPIGLRPPARGEPIDPRRHQIDAEVKAVTWHGLKVMRQEGGWMAEVIVDI